MPVTVADLIARLKLDIREFEAGTAATERSTQKIRKSFKDTQDTADKAFLGIRASWQGVTEAFLGFSLANVVTHGITAVKQFVTETARLGL